MFKQTKPWVLGSSSPKRAEILNKFSFDFKIIKPNIDESILAKETIAAYVQRLALEKNLVVQKTQPKAKVIITSDSSFELAGKILGKAENQNEALKMLSQMSGKISYSYSAVYVYIADQKPIKILDKTKVTFFKYSKSVLANYIRTGEWENKAGSCSIEDLGSFLIKKTEGSFFGVLGFPIEAFINEALKRKLIILPDN